MSINSTSTTNSTITSPTSPTSSRFLRQEDGKSLVRINDNYSMGRNQEQIEFDNFVISYMDGTWHENQIENEEIKENEENDNDNPSLSLQSSRKLTENDFSDLTFHVNLQHFLCNDTQKLNITKHLHTYFFHILRMKKGRKYYQIEYKPYYPKKYILEKNLNNYNEIMDRQLKQIFLLRHPLSRAISIYYFWGELFCLTQLKKDRKFNQIKDLTIGQNRNCNVSVFSMCYFISLIFFSFLSFYIRFLLTASLNTMAMNLQFHRLKLQMNMLKLYLIEETFLVLLTLGVHFQIV